MSKHDELISGLDRSIDLLISVRRNVKSGRLAERERAKILSQLQSIEQSIAGMVVDPEPADQSRGMTCPNCNKPIKVTIS